MFRKRNLQQWTHLLDKLSKTKNSHSEGDNRTRLEVKDVHTHTYTHTHTRHTNACNSATAIVIKYYCYCYCQSFAVPQHPVLMFSLLSMLPFNTETSWCIALSMRQSVDKCFDTSTIVSVSLRTHTLKSMTVTGQLSLWRLRSPPNRITLDGIIFMGIGWQPKCLAWNSLEISPSPTIPPAPSPQTPLDLTYWPNIKHHHDVSCVECVYVDY